jgi:hypothetical protein
VVIPLDFALKEKTPVLPLRFPAHRVSPRPDFLTAEDVLQTFHEMTLRLPPQEMAKLAVHIGLNLVAAHLPFIVEAIHRSFRDVAGLHVEVPGLDVEAITARYHEVVRGVQDRGRALATEHRDPPKRFAGRDAEIVRLKDKRRLSYGRIGPQLLLKNPAWGKHGADGKVRPLGRLAVRDAYRRAKGKKRGRR